jgi:hypothetical protein
MSKIKVGKNDPVYTGNSFRQKDFTMFIVAFSVKRLPQQQLLSLIQY